MHYPETSEQTNKEFCCFCVLNSDSCSLHILDEVEVYPSISTRLRPFSFAR